MNIELSTIARCHVVMPWLGQLVVNRSGMIGVLAFGIIDLVELPQHAGEVGLTLRRCRPTMRAVLTRAATPRCLRLITSWVFTSSR